MSTTARKRREKAAPVDEETEPMCVVFMCQLERLDGRRAFDSILCADGD